MAFCEVCNDIYLKNYTNLYLDINLTDLEKSVQARNCLICNMIWDGKTALETLPDQKVQEIVIHNMNSTRPRNTFQDTLVMQVTFENSTSKIYEFYSTQDYKSLPAPHPFSLIYSKTHVPGDTGSDLSLSWICEKLQHCLKTHTSCRYQIDAPLPRRVLNLGTPSGLNDTTGDLKLYESQGEQSSYLCLSHCWGGSLPIRTTRATLENYRRGISWSSLPKTFQDAVIFTRRLGVKFLWIDSMCIIQDDNEDWERESASMSTIYQNATLVLGAVMSPNGKGGCFSTGPLHGWRHRLQVDVDGHSLEFYLREQLSHFDYPTGVPWDDIPVPPLLTRAWAFQERILARRFVFFLSGELIWECSEVALCECSGSAIIQLWRPENLKDLMSKTPDYWWHRWVASYSDLCLSFPSDKLPAISGLAKYIENATNGAPANYLAGLRKSSLAADLLWFTWRPNPRPAERRAPTWSWASVDGGVRFINGNLNPDPTLLVDGRCIPKGQDIFGQVSSGYLILYGLLIEVSLRKIALSETDLYRVNKGSWEIRPAFKLTKDERFENTHLDTPWDLKSGWSNVGPNKLQYEGVLYCIKIGTGPHNIYYLILKPVDVQETVYERVGIVRTPIFRYGWTWWEGCSKARVKII